MAAERLYFHVRAFRIFADTGEIQKLIIVRDMIREQIFKIMGAQVFNLCRRRFSLAATFLSALIT